MTIANQISVGATAVRIWPPAGDTKQYGHSNVPVNLVIQNLSTTAGQNVAIGGPSVVATGSGSVTNHGLFLRPVASATTVADKVSVQVVNEELWAIGAVAGPALIQVLAVNAS
jgi:hypothetical protein